MIANTLQMVTNGAPGPDICAAKKMGVGRQEGPGHREVLLEGGEAPGSQCRPELRHQGPVVLQ